MTTENTHLRSEFINTQVIARNSGKRLGVVKEVLVDIDRREVVALGLRDNLLSVSGIPKYMYLDSIRQTGDVILVEDETVIEDIEIEVYSKLVNCEVITEAGEPLGKVRDFQFDAENGTVNSIIIASLGIPQIPEQFISTYELSIEEVVSSGPGRLIVFEGSEERIEQISVGLLERLGIGRPVWERDKEDYYPQTIDAGNQLPTGTQIRTPISTPVDTREPVMEERWDEDEWQEPRTAPPMRQQAEAIPYEEEYEENNWEDADPEVYDSPVYEAPPVKEYEYEDVTSEDVWDDDIKPEPYNPTPVNIPQKEKAPEYEEEPG
ncbi:PRC-barrel domain-containing protein [Waterburya agarophytonicola K14]|uniref:PRC-barrel domain-containing protein n=1 Tax=Waterburya agarophytonicola KI4 TaxID=2874699 RepID=A0A964BM83_9CYAN|nr:PRC-barrel domain-containing protein [Waterburya agarophytonicola]MCC0175719.1 PRC-barrel domain-containing protein [Waterburya agarophytonicola KI4]